MNVLIYGLGISGKSALKFALKSGEDVYLYNQGDVESWYSDDLGVPKEKCFKEGESLPCEIDKVILSPGIPRSKDTVQSLIKSGASVICDIEYIYPELKGKVIAITGTNGKTTTADMCCKLLSQLGKKVFLGGNIGTAACEYKDEEYIVLELSSYQLESIENFKADVSVLTNLYPNHLDRYEDSFELYKKAKLNLIRNNKELDTLIYHSTFDIFNEVKNSYYFEVSELSQKAFGEKFDFSKTKVKGAHNLENFLMCYLAVKSTGVKFSQEEFQSFIDSYSGVEHRLEFVGEFDGLQVYNDSKSTNIKATEIALNSFSEDSYLLLTGVAKGVSFKELLENRNNLKAVYLLGECAEFLNKDLEGIIAVTVQSIEEVLENLKGKKGVLIFSPGHQSFDLYKNFMERGRIFKSEVVKKFS